MDSTRETYDTTVLDLSHQRREAEGHAEDMAVEGEVNLILPFRHRPVCSDSKMSKRAFQNPHSFGWEQGIRAVCISKETLRKAFFVAAPMHLTVCVSLPLCLCSVPTPTQYPSTPISVIFSSQNGTQPVRLTAVENSTSSHLDAALTCADVFLSLSRHVTNASGSAKAARGRGVKRQEGPEREGRERGISPRTAVN